MRRAYLLIVVPAAIVGIFYLAIFHSLGMPIGWAPFLGAAGAFVAALILRPALPAAQSAAAGRGSHGHHRDFPLDSRREHLRRIALHLRAAHRLQPALHLVRHGVRVPWRHEDEHRRGAGARRASLRGRQRRAGGTDRRRTPAAARSGAAGRAASRGRLHRARGDQRRAADRARCRAKSSRSWTSNAPIQARAEHSAWRISRRSTAKDEVKFVIASRRDYEFAREFTVQHGLAQPRAAGAVFSRFCRPQGNLAGTRGAAARGMDFGRSPAGAAGPATAQIHLGPVDAGSLRAPCRIRRVA